MKATSGWFRAIVLPVVIGLLLAGTHVIAAEENAAQREDALRALLLDKLGPDAGTITVSVMGKKVFLTGQVEQRATQELAEEVAFSFPGVKRVRNRVKAVHDASLGGGQLLDEVGDAALESEVKGALLAEIGRYGAKIEVEAVEGAVSLRGVVPDTARKDLALKAAARVKRVVRVVDLLTVSG